MASEFVEIPRARSEEERARLRDAFREFARTSGLNEPGWVIRDAGETYTKLCRWRPLAPSHRGDGVSTVVAFMRESLEDLERRA